MAKDTLTLKMALTADFQAIQCARRILNDELQKTILVLGLQEMVEHFLSKRKIGNFALSSALSVSRVSETKKGTYPPPILKDGIVTIWDYELDRQIQAIEVDGPDWADFLSREVENSFRYDHPIGFFTAIRETRRGRPVWYAHRRQGGKLKRFYLGVPHNLSGDKLADVAQKMSRWAQKISLHGETNLACGYVGNLERSGKFSTYPQALLLLHFFKCFKRG